ncbi:LOW QUALITY PROTEIN: hypothetical protein OSB04_005315 [Centaurea solstitialis]|uniref:Transposase n=1 Tax=Centaurea solstitialis TaxID=347529 RepID=A0AA38TSF2_9ASTR|nr:LOW QUALITY PROTEIN: hypothetical protein OSB04_005315 [Centaurea solstitialis]
MATSSEARAPRSNPRAGDIGAFLFQNLPRLFGVDTLRWFVHGFGFGESKEKNQEKWWRNEESLLHRNYGCYIAIFNESTQCMNKSTACPTCLVALTVCIGAEKIAPSGQFHRGDHAGPTIILEAVASYDEWIWHAFFGVPGATNDIIVVNQSPVFNDLFEDKAPDSSFVLNGTHYNHGYYLADGIYPEYPHDDERRIHFKERQESARKDIERTFATLQSKWHMVKRPARVWTRTKLQEIMYTCIILHNMIREDEGISDYHFDLI